MSDFQISENGEPLDHPCRGCNGDPGKVAGICRTCHGNGFVLTDTGRNLLAFLRRHTDIRKPEDHE